MNSDADTRTLTRLLAWYRDMGLDCIVPETAPMEALAGPALAPPRPAIAPARPATAPAAARPPIAEASAQTRPSPPGEPPTRRFAVTSPEAAETEARALAQRATSLAELETALAGFDGCSLKATAKNLCFARGAPTARLMLIGEAPGREEDLEGKPFVGRAGRLLDRMLAAAGLAETDVYITNIIYWRPPGNRTPTPQEAETCRPFLERQIELVNPSAVLLLGGAAAKQVLGTADGIMKLRGKWRDIEVAGRGLRAMATLHPAYLLRTPAAKRQAWRDLLTVVEALAAAR